MNDTQIGISRKPKPVNTTYTSDYYNKRLMLWVCWYNNTYKLKLNNGVEISTTFTHNTPIRKMKFTNWTFKTELITISENLYDLNDPKFNQILLNEIYN